VTANTPIPIDAFVAELESLDSDAFAALVAETYAATADDVAVDGPRVTVTDGGRRTELVAVADADRSVPEAAVDAVAVASDAPLDEGVAEGDVEVVTPADLRQRLLYAVPPVEANAIADRLLGVPARSGAYEVPDADGDAADTGGDAADTGGDAADTGGDAAVNDTGGADDDTDALVSGTEAPDGEGDRTNRDDDTAGGSTGAVAASGATAGDRGSESRSTGRGDAGSAEDSQSDDAPSDRPRRLTAAAAVAVVALLVAAAGAGFAAGAAGIGGPGGIGGAADDGTTDPAPAESGATGPANESDDGSEGSLGGDDGADTVSVADGDPTGEAERNTALAPTCERSALQVVQIQMNALRYNDNATNDGIRTLRAFASPQNREVVGSTDEYAELFETPRYAPMLTYDAAQYSVPVIDDETAEVEVVTRENGSVTGRYEFRLVRVGGGTGESDGSLGDVDDCWMTDAVAASSE
jgi:hypothetical protein